MTEHSNEQMNAREEKAAGVDYHPHPGLPTTRVSEVLDAGIRRLGAFASWFWLAVMGLILTNVTLRYVFTDSSQKLEELVWHFYGAVWLIGLSYTLVYDHHVRVDVLHERYSLRTQAWIELLGITLLLMPFLVIFLTDGWAYFWDSWVRDEAAQTPSGLANRWAIKFFIPLSLGLLIVAGFSRWLKCTALLFGFPRPLPVKRAD